MCTLCRYVLKVTVSRGYGGSIVEYQDFVVVFHAIISEKINYLCTTICKSSELFFFFFGGKGGRGGGAGVEGGRNLHKILFF